MEKKFANLRIEQEAKAINKDNGIYFYVPLTAEEYGDDKQGWGDRLRTLVEKRINEGLVFTSISDAWGRCAGHFTVMLEMQTIVRNAIGVIAEHR